MSPPCLQENLSGFWRWLLGVSDIDFLVKPLLSEGSRSIGQERERRGTIDQESHISYTRLDTPFFVILFFD